MWKHKTKWLVRGGRKVRCYLCGKKILAKGDPFLFHQDTGYYSHQSCMTESTTISGNERRRAVKKIAVGAAVVGAIAAGAGKFIDISSQSKGSLNSPDTQTILTSQGLILPSLTSDPANPVAGQMWYRSDAGVTAHFDSIQNRVVYSSEINDGNVHVTSKGIINGLSVLPNDGTGWFGPDTTSGATAPGQYGGTYTETSGVQESLTYINSQGGGHVYIVGGNIQISKPVTLTTQNNIVVEGSTVGGVYNSPQTGTTYSSSGTAIFPSSTFSSGSANYLFTFTGTSPGNAGKIVFQNIALSGGLVGTANTPVCSLIQILESSTSNYQIPGSTFSNVKFTNCYTGLASKSNGGPCFLDNTQFTYCQTAVNLQTLNHVVNTEFSSCGAIGASAIILTAYSVWSNIIYVSGNTGSTTFSLQAPMTTISNLYIETGNETYIFQVYHGLTLIGLEINWVGAPTIFYIVSSQTDIDIGWYSSNIYLFTNLNVWFYSPSTAGSGRFQMNGVRINNPTGYTIETLSNPGSLKMTVVNSPPITEGTPTLSTNPPVSGTAYQNTNPYDIRLKIPVTYSPTSSAAATLATGTSSSSTVTTSTKVSYPAGITTGIINTYEMVVPAGHYFELVVTNATIGTVEVQVA